MTGRTGETHTVVDEIIAVGRTDKGDGGERERKINGKTNRVSSVTGVGERGKRNSILLVGENFDLLSTQKKYKKTRLIDA